MQYRVLDAVIGSQAAADHRGDAMFPQILNDAGGKRVGQVMVTGPVGVFINFDTFVDLEIIGFGVKSFDKVEAFGTDDGVSRPAHVDIGITADGAEHRMLTVCDPDCLR